MNSMNRLERKIQANSMDDKVDITKLNLIEIKVNETGEIYMTKSSDLVLKEKNLLTSSDIINPSPSHDGQHQPASAPIPSYIEDKKDKTIMLLYNPEINTEEIKSFMRAPEKFSFLDMVNININQDKGAASASHHAEVIEVVGPKQAFLVNELTLYIIKFL